MAWDREETGEIFMPTTTRRTLLTGAAAAAAAGSLSRPARAAGYPEYPIKFMIPDPPGAQYDVIGRIVTEYVPKIIGGSMIAVNKAGAAGVVATQFTANSKPDGYTLTLTTISTVSIVPNMFVSPPYDPGKDLTNISIFAAGAFYLGVNANVATDLKDLISKCKAAPGKYTYASSGIGSSVHLAALLFCEKAGIQMTHVPYNGQAPAILDVAAGRADMVFSPAVVVQPYLQSGKLRVLGITSAKRSEVMPDVAPLGDTLPGYDFSSWYGISGPAGLPKDIVTTLNGAMNTLVKDPEFSAHIKGIGSSLLSGTPEDANRKILSDLATMRKLILDAGIKQS
jgi:tripartite-type tricarboxylate transporter receptor subunit TctC